MVSRRQIRENENRPSSSQDSSFFAHHINEHQVHTNNHSTYNLYSHLKQCLPPNQPSNQIFCRSRSLLNTASACRKPVWHCARTSISITIPRMGISIDRLWHVPSARDFLNMICCLPPFYVEGGMKRISRYNVNGYFCDSSS